MGRLTKEQRALRDAMKPGERSFIEALRRVAKAAEKMCVDFRKVAAAADALQKLRFRKVDNGR